jgi:hypothetical protein
MGIPAEVFLGILGLAVFGFAVIVAIVTVAVMRATVAMTRHAAKRNLFPCPDCSHQVSQMAESCPNCGRPFSSVGQE